MKYTIAKMFQILRHNRFLSAYGLCVVLSSFVSVITFRKLKKKKIIELLNVY